MSETMNGAAPQQQRRQAPREKGFKKARRGISRLAALSLPAIVLTAAVISASVRAEAFAPASLSADSASSVPARSRSLQGVLFAQQEQQEQDKVSAFDPFVDYNEFQDNESERENVIFLKSGRLLSFGIFGGYEGMTWTMREMYGDSLSAFGGFINFFFDLQLALQIQMAFREHYFSPLKSRPRFSNYGIDFKYYFKKQNLVKGIAALNPYVVIGPFLLKVSRFYPETLEMTAVGRKTNSPVKDAAAAASGETEPAPPGPSDKNPTKQEIDNTGSESKTGVRFGAGLEIPVFKKVFFGLEINYSYVPLPFQNQDLSALNYIVDTFSPSQKAVQKPRKSFLQRVVEPDAPANLRQRRFVGDMVSAFIILGVNF